MSAVLASATNRADKTINFRAPAAKKALIDQAAEVMGMKRTEFMLEALCERAHEVLADRTHFSLDHRGFADFHRLLDEPVSDAAIALLAKSAPWER